MRHKNQERKEQLLSRERVINRTRLRDDQMLSLSVKGFKIIMISILKVQNIHEQKRDFRRDGN